MEEWLRLDGVEALIQRQRLEHLSPPARVTHISQVKLPVPNMLQAGEGRLKGGRERAGAGTAVLGAEVEVTALVPFRIDVLDIVEFASDWRRPDELRLQMTIDKTLRLRFEFRLQALGTGCGEGAYTQRFGGRRFFAMVFFYGAFSC